MPSDEGVCCISMADNGAYCASSRGGDDAGSAEASEVASASIMSSNPVNALRTVSRLCGSGVVGCRINCCVPRDKSCLSEGGVDSGMSLDASYSLEERRLFNAWGAITNVVRASKGDQQSAAING
jgi:hypothetical protein